MKIKAKTSFCGILTMSKGEIREYNNEVVLADLLKAGYIEEVVPEDAGKKPKTSTRRGAKANESK